MIVTFLPLLARVAENCEESVGVGRAAFLVLQPIRLPGNVVVGIHYAANNVDDEEEQEEQPVGQVACIVPACVRYDEDDERDRGGGLC